MILEDENIFSARKNHFETRDTLIEEISKQEALLGKARHMRVVEKIDDDDFNGLKQDYKKNISDLNERLTLVSTILDSTDNERTEWIYSQSSVFQSYRHQDISGKRFIIKFLPPSPINPITKRFDHIKIDKALSKIFITN